MSESLFQLIFFGFFGLIVALIIYSFIRQSRRNRQHSQALAAYAAAHNYGFVVDPQRLINVGSFQTGTNHNCVSGTLQPAEESFFSFEQTDVRREGKSTVTYRRTIMSVDIPDTRLQMIVNSKINDDNQSGGYLARYRSGQHYEAEGEFSKFFDIYVPKGAEVEGLAILTPNVLDFILQNFADYDIEIIGSHMYLYIYRFIEVPDLDRLIRNTGRLVEMMRLSAQDAIKLAATTEPVARVAEDVTQPRRLAKHWPPVVVAVAILVSLSFFIRGPITAVFTIIIFVIIGGSLIVQSVHQSNLKRAYREMKEKEPHA